jgi:predicted RND superfamily exporter protein
LGAKATSEFEQRDWVPRALTRFGLRFPRTVLLLWLVIALLSAIESKNLRIETSTDSVLDRSGPAWAFYEESQDLFGGDEIISILLEGKEPFERSGLNEVVRLTEVFEGLAGVWRVDSLATVPLIRRTREGGISLDAALAAGVPVSDDALRELSDEIQFDRIAPGTVISKDGRDFGINLVLEKGAEDYYSPILNAVTKELDGQRAWVSGVPIFRIETDLWTRRELITFIPISLIVIGFLCFFLLLDPRLSLIGLFSSGVGSFVVLGVMALTGTPLTISTVVLPSVLLALGCAYSMHFLTAASAGERGDRFSERLLEVSVPVTLSGLTTALGFLAIGFVRIRAIQDMGSFGALGVLTVLLTTLTIVPAALKLCDTGGGDTRLRRFMSESASQWLIRWVVARRRLVISLWLVVMAIVGIGIFRLRVETDVIRWFPRDHAIRVAYDEIRNRLSGISPMNVVVEGDSSKSVSSPDVLLALGGLTRYLESLKEVGKAISIADPIIEMNRVFTGETGDSIPTQKEKIEQCLLLLESTEYTRDLIADDRRSANVLIRVDENSSQVLLEVAKAAERWWARNGVEGFAARTTGVMHEFARSEQAIARGQIRGLVFVLVTVGAILIAAFRSVSMAGATLLANAVPIVMAFGAMGLSGIRIDAGTVVVGCIAFGIAVDDTIHAVTEFSRCIESGLSKEKSLFVAYGRVFPPIVFTTIVISAGFLVLGFSKFALIRNLGVVTSAVMVLCLLADVILLPALLNCLSRRVRASRVVDG